MRETLAVSERRACRVLGQVRRLKDLELEKGRLKRLLADQALDISILKTDGWQVNHKERIWRLEGLKVPARQPKRGRLWFNDGSCIRLRPEPQPRLGLRFRIRSDA